MKHIIKLTIILITFTLVGYDKIPSVNKQSSQPEQTTFIARQSGTPLNPFALNRLAKQTVVEIVRESYLNGGDKYVAKGSGVIIGRKGSTYYVLTANHISDIDDGLSVLIRSEKPGERGEVLPLKFIRRYPRQDLAVVAFDSSTDYVVAEVGEASQLDDDHEVYVAGWPGNDNSEGFQFTPAKVTNPRVGDNLTYQPTEVGEDVYKGMSGGAVLNEAGQLVGIHVGLKRFGGDGEGVLISTFLRMVSPEVSRVLVRSTSVALPSPTRKNRTARNSGNAAPVPSPSRTRGNQTVRNSGNATRSRTKNAVLTRNSISTATNLTLVRTFTGHSNWFFSVAISPDGQTIVSGNADTTIKVWDLATGKLKATLTGHSYSVSSVAISPDGKTIVSGSFDDTIKVWDLATGNLKATLSGHSDLVWSVAISRDGKTIVSGSEDKTIKVWDLATGKLKATLSGHSYLVRSVAISPDGKTIVSGSEDKTIKVWDLKTGKLKATLSGHSSDVYSVAISPDGKTIVSGSLDDTIKVWDLATGKLKATLSGHRDLVRSVAISPDGKTIVSGNWRQTIKVWDLATGKLKATLTGHSYSVLSVAISPDGKTIVSGGDDDTIKVWSAR